MATDQTTPDESGLWSDRPRQIFPLIRLQCAQRSVCAYCALKNFLWSDYCALECHALIRLVCARIRLWPDWGALENASEQTEVRSKLPLIRPKWAQNYLWPDCCAFKIASDQTDGRSKTPLIILKCARNRLWSDRSAFQITYDQTVVRSKLPLTRLTGARKRLRSDWSALKIASYQTEVRSKLPIIRRLCDRNCLWPDWRALEDASDQTEMLSKLPLTRLKCVRPVEYKSASKCFVSLNFQPNGYVFENHFVALMFLFLILYCFYFRSPSSTISIPHNEFSNTFRASQPKLRSRPKWSMIRASQTKVTSDQTNPDWVLLWSDYSALKSPCAFNVRSKTSSVQTIVHSNVTLWSD